MSFKLSRRHALYAGVATVAAAAGVSVALRRHASEAVTPDALQAVGHLNLTHRRVKHSNFLTFAANLWYLIFGQHGARHVWKKCRY